ncbi:hypothetical protein GWK78_02625 [Candidatus Saccharibacteria bacterium oral taxon 488]|jgi:hypothetical protein|nr:hypothetical protein GWK78_02625 [Candidatus Saccharibacteria bacterium oral taxon 488]
MGGYQDGDRWVDPDGTSHTVNSTNDPNVPGGYYYNQHGPDGHATAVYNSDGTFANVAANRDWVEVPRQDQD